jgi:hypothetical protein
MQLNSSRQTVDRVAADGEIDRLHDLAIGMEPEDGIICLRHRRVRSRLTRSV